MILRKGRFLPAALMFWALAVPARPAFDRSLDFGWGTRSMGLAGAASALGDDPYAMLWNPAAGVYMSRAQAGLSPSLLLGGDLSGLSLAGVLPRIHGSALGFAWGTLGGKGLEGGQDHAFTGSAAVPVDPAGRAAVGASLRLMRGSSHGGFPGGSASGMGLDLGLMFRSPVRGGQGHFAAGLSVLGASTLVRWSGGLEEKVPALFDLGFAYSPWPASTFTLDMTSTDKARDGRSLEKSFRVGAEHLLRGAAFAFRLGYARRFRLGDQMGFGLTHRTRGPWAFEYALAAEGAGRGMSHRLSSVYTFQTLPFQSDRVLAGELEAQRLALAEAELRRLRERQAVLTRLLEVGRKEASDSLREVAVVKGRLADVEALKVETARLAATIEARDQEINRLKTEVEAEKERVRARQAAAPSPPRPRDTEIDQNLLRARDLMKQEDFLGALKAYEKVLASNPRDGEARRSLRSCLDKVPKENLYSTEFLALYQKGIGHQTRGEFEDAIKVWKEFLAAYPYALQVEEYLDEAQSTLKRIEEGK